MTAFRGAYHTECSRARVGALFMRAIFPPPFVGIQAATAVLAQAAQWICFIDEQPLWGIHAATAVLAQAAKSWCYGLLSGYASLTSSLCILKQRRVIVRDLGGLGVGEMSKSY